MLESSQLSNSSVIQGWCRPRRRARRRKGSTIRLGKRRGFYLGSRPVIHWPGFMACPFRVLKKLVFEMASNGRLVEAYSWSLPFLRPQLFPLC
ncbi:PREDICTED: uncharacterized protein LOC109208162 [Nicotiana attenuata]|uniref:Uncharacterized protein n=1 Tax=Nicotiana attenuata TaxID=49451 RepID=A0A314KSX2_NICAT|nr:PREDICTED: uncharacterized protein LOC109208162 [Nicotiana attenuata]OIT31844.1 hypothetical protein A4A49_34830 [Nicotiana attenuata]